MADDVQVKIGDVTVILPAEVRRGMLERAAVALVGRIQRRTEAGLDVNGRPFAPMSPDYKKARAGAGYSQEEKLHLTGSMLASLHVREVTPDTATIGFSGSGREVKFEKRKTAKGTGQYTESKQGGVTVRRETKITHKATRGDKEVSNALKAQAHNEGLGHLPKRRFFAVSPEDRIAMARAAFNAIKFTR